MAFFIHNGLRLNYEELGQGKPLVLISGITCDSNHWQMIKQELSKHYRLIMPDNRGTGRSSIPLTSYLISDMAEDVIALLNDLNIDKAFILGHSMGGAVAQYLGYKFANRIDKLIISHSFTKFRPASILYCKHDYLLCQSYATPEVRATGILPFIYSDEFVADKQNVDNFVNTLKIDSTTQALLSYQQQIFAISEFDSNRWIGNIVIPTLVIAGEFDKLAPSQDAQLIHKQIINSKLVIMSGAHVPMWEIPAQYIDLIISFA